MARFYMLTGILYLSRGCHSAENIKNMTYRADHDETRETPRSVVPHQGLH